MRVTLFGIRGKLDTWFVLTRSYLSDQTVQYESLTQPKHVLCLRVVKRFMDCLKCGDEFDSYVWNLVNKYTIILLIKWGYYCNW